jgi:tetratricopeptide (TPR) repeat protein
MLVLRATGIESEAELEFSALDDLLRCLPNETKPPEVGRSGARIHDRLSMGIETLDIVSRVAEHRPVLLTLDDIQWADQASLDAILFAARRFSADRVAVLLAARDSYASADCLRGFQQLRLEGLVTPDAAQLVQRSAGGPVAEQVAVKLQDATRGNPLALTEISRMLATDQLAGLAPIEEPLTVGTAVEQAFARRLGKLPDEAWRALVVVAVSSSEAVEVIASALRAADLDMSALECGEDEGLVVIADGQVRFDHPLIRSVVHQMARPSARRSAHRAVAKALAESNSERRAWHLAAATITPTEVVAAALEDAARVARERGGYAAAALALERAASLTPEPAQRGRRRYLAAQAAWDAGRTDRALDLLADALTLPADRRSRAEMLYLRGHIQHLTGPVRSAFASLVEAAELIENEDPTRAAEFLHDAAESLGYAYQPADMLAAAQRAYELAAPGTGGRFLAEMRTGEAQLYLGRWAEAIACFERAVAMSPTAPDVQWPPFLQANAALGLSWLDQRAEAVTMAEQAVARARAQNALTTLVYALEIEAWTRMRSGQWHGCYAVGTEVVQLAGETGQSTQMALALADLSTIDAARGDATSCRAHLVQLAEMARRKQLRYVAVWGRHAEALLELGLGNVAEAITLLEEIDRELIAAHAFGEEGCPVPDLVEAYHRAGRLADAQWLLERFQREGVREYGLFGATHTARCQGLLAPEDGYRPYFERALQLHDQLGDPFATARTALLFGERLRRSGHRAQARTQLRSALDTFVALGADPWSARCRGELRHQ